MWWMQQPYRELLPLSTRLLVASLVCIPLAVVLLLTSFAPASAVFAALAVASAATGWFVRSRASRTGKLSSR
jgi:membrane protein implicated in regulation of membrane protease activity